MAGDWIKVEHALPDKPEVIQMATTLGIDSDAVVGKLIRVWTWFDNHTEDGNAPVTVRALLERYTGVTGFVTSMLQVGWIHENEGMLSVTRFDRHNGQTAKNRANTNRRVTKSRKCNGTSVTDVTGGALQKPLPEKRREEKSEDTPNPKGDGFLVGFDKPSKTRARLSDTEKKNTRVNANTATMDKIGAIMNRRPGTLWTVAEKESLDRCKPTDAEIDGMAAYYDAEEPPGEKFYRRKNLQTLLNNWPSELDAARKWIEKQ